MKISVLASGSKGNTTFIKTDQTSLLIDAGLSYSKTNVELAQLDFDLKSLNAVLLTHEHIDHVRGLPMLLKRTDAMLYTPLETFSHLYMKTTHDYDPARHYPVYPDQPFILNDLTITPIAISHDATSAVGYIINVAEKTLVYMTDIGYLPVDDYPKISNADMYIFEANYDVSLLFSSSRPYYLKQRIDSIKGHLSNADSAYHMSRLIGPNTKTIVLAHPSEECNTEQHALATYYEVFSDYDLSLEDYDVIVAKQHKATKIIDL